MLRRPWLATALAVIATLAVPAIAGAAGTSGDDGKAIVVFSGDVEVPAGETVDGVYVANGDVKIRGKVDGDVFLIAGDALISGSVSGDVFTLSGTARLLPSAEVGGDVGYGDNHPVVAGRARVFGDVTQQDFPDIGGVVPLLGFFLVWLAVGISAAVLGLLLLLMAPRAADALYERSRGRVGPTIAIGIAIGIALPVGAVIAAVTVVGIPLALGVLLAILPLLAVAYVVGAWALGRRLLGPPRHRMLAFLLGLGILRAVELVPLVGFIVSLAAIVVGLGLIGGAIGAARKDPDPDPLGSPGS